MAGLASYGHDASCRFAGWKTGLWTGVREGSDRLHGLMERQSQDLNVEVNGVAGLVVRGPAPIAVFEEQALERGHLEVAGGQFEELEAAFLEQGRQRGHAGRADLLPGPPGPWRAGGVKARVGRSHDASGVE